VRKEIYLSPPYAQPHERKTRKEMRCEKKYLYLPRMLSHRKEKQAGYVLGNYFVHHTTAPNHKGKTENTLKKMGYI